MKAHELAAMLQETPDADVLLASALTGYAPAAFDERNIALNNEANAWFIFPARGDQLKPLDPPAGSLPAIDLVVKKLEQAFASHLEATEYRQIKLGVAGTFDAQEAIIELRGIIDQLGTIGGTTPEAAT